jgi:regulator of G-protein signaling
MQPGPQQRVLRPAVFSKLEHLLREMQDSQHGVPVRSQKLFLTSIPAAFMGYDLIEWLMDRLCIEDSLEAVHLANLLCQFGYYFPVNEQKNLLVKDDSSLYRFQSPYYWPSQHHTPDSIEYAIYLYKRAQRRRNIHGLEPGLPDYEMDALNNLKKILSGKWDFVTMQAEEQLKVAKDRKKGDKIINDSQEKAYWRVYRPPPGYSTLVENSPVPTREQRVKARRNNKELLREEMEFLKKYLSISRVRTSQVAESLLDFTDTFVDYDPILVGVGPSNPWMSDDISFWEINKPIPEVPTKKRVERWAISLEDTVSDPLGVQELLGFMKKEYCHENMRFWMGVQELKRGPGTESKIKKKVKEIWEEFLSPGAGAEINIDGKTMEETKLAMKSPTRHTFDRAADHVYTLLLKKDCYPRFLRSEHYKTLLANALNPGSSRKRFFNFPVRKKPSHNHPANPGQPCTSTTARDPRDFTIYGMDVKNEQECADQSLTSSREFDEACPWETGQKSPLPDVSRNRKLSTAGSEHPLPIDYTRQKPETHVKLLVSESSSLPGPMQESERHNRVGESKSCSDQSQMISKTILEKDETEEDRRGMEVDTADEFADTIKVSENRNAAEHEDIHGKLSDTSIFSAETGSPRSPRSYQESYSSSQADRRIDNPNGFPRKTSMEKKTRYATLETADSSAVESAVAGEEQMAGGTASMEEEEPDGWISEEVCPWEDDTLTPTWL